MKNIINGLKIFADFFFKTFYKMRIGRVIMDYVSKLAMSRSVSVSHGDKTLILTVPNSLNRWRVETYSTKEPEMLTWIDGLNQGSVLWDIGANVGLYSIYAAKARNCTVCAFEPSIFNLELLARNTFLNNLSGQIIIVPLPLAGGIGINKLHLTSTDWGGALSTFGSDAIGHDGKPIGENGKFEKVFEYQTLGISMDDAVDMLNIPMPDYIKMDVDGIEHIILGGGREVLKSVKAVIIEINDDFEEQGAVSHRILKESGLILSEKVHSEVVEKIDEFRATFNQIWVRK